MPLIPETVARDLPAIGSDPVTPMRDSLVRVRLYDPCGPWHWLIMEWDGRELCFGIILTARTALAGQFTLSELESIGAGEQAIRFDEKFLPETVGGLSDRFPPLRELLAEPVPRELNTRDLITLEGLD